MTPRASNGGGAGERRGPYAFMIDIGEPHLVLALYVDPLCPPPAPLAPTPSPVLTFPARVKAKYEAAHNTAVACVIYTTNKMRFPSVNPRFTHVEILVPTKYAPDDGDKGAPYVSYSIFAGRKAHALPRTYLNPSYKFFWFPVSVAKIKTVTNHLRSAVARGFGFDAIGMYTNGVLRGPAFNPWTQKKPAVFCSSLIAHSLLNANVLPKGTNANRLSPAGLVRHLSTACGLVEIMNPNECTINASVRRGAPLREISVETRGGGGGVAKKRQLAATATVAQNHKDRIASSSRAAVVALRKKEDDRRASALRRKTEFKIVAKKKRRMFFRTRQKQNRRSRKDRTRIAPKNASKNVSGAPVVIRHFHDHVHQHVNEHAAAATAGFIGNKPPKTTHPRNARWGSKTLALVVNAFRAAASGTVSSSDGGSEEETTSLLVTVKTV